MEIAQLSYKSQALDKLAPTLRADLLAVAGLVQAGEKVLDLGCGDGTLLRFLSDRLSVVGRGVELSEEGVLACVHKGLTVRQGDLDEGLSDYPDGSFDTVILSNTLPYLDNPANILNEMLRVGRRAIVSFPNWGHWRCRLSLLFTGRTPTPPGQGADWNGSPRPRPLSLGDFESFCVQNRMTITRSIYLDGERRIRWEYGRDLRATMAIYELACK